MSETNLVLKDERLRIKNSESTEDTSMHDTFIAMSEAREIQLKVPNRGKFTRKQVIQAFEDSFELIGGIPRLAAWAHSNPGEFFKLYSKLLPSQAMVDFGHDGVLRIIHSIAPGKLDELPDSRPPIEGETNG